MNIKELLKKKIVKEVLTHYVADWSVLIYDTRAGEIMIDLFTKSELNDYSISDAFLINANKPDWDFPAVYFIAGTRANFERINQEYSDKVFSKFYVVIIDLVDDLGILNPLIKSKVISCNIKVEEERLFLCDLKNSVKSMEFLLDTKFTVYKMPCIKENPPCTDVSTDDSTVADYLVLDRSFDLFTPLLHFFTFKSILYETYPDDNTIDDGSKLFKEIRYEHMADVHKTLEYNINKLNQNLDSLNNKKLGTAELSKMVLDAPANVKLKESIDKYSNYLSGAFTKLEYLQKPLGEDPNFNNLIESELILALGEKEGKKVQIDLGSLFDLLASTQIQTSDKLRLLYLIKFKGLVLTHTEKNMLKQSVFSDSDIDLKLDLSNKYKRDKNLPYKYEISRFEPFLADIVKDSLIGDFKSFLIKTNNLSTNITQKKKIFSLRKSSMLTIKKKEVNRRKLIIYIRNGMCLEECRLAYELSKALGIELLLGSDKILKPNEIIPIVKAFYQEKQINNKK